MIWIGVVAAVLVAGLGVRVGRGVDGDGFPVRWRVQAGTVLLAGSVVGGLAAVPAGLSGRAWSVTTLVVLVVGVLLVWSTARRAVGATSWAEMFTAAVTIAATGPLLPLLAVAVPGGLALGVYLANHDVGGAALIAAGVMLAPARLTLGAGRRRERTRTAIEASMAGIVSGGVEWHPRQAERRAAPVKVRFDRRQAPRRVWCPLPPGWRADAVDGLRREVRERLDGYARPWTVQADHSCRHFVAEVAEPLPRRLAVTVADLRRKLAASPSELAFWLGEGLTEDGSKVDIWWDPASGDPHSLVGGRTKSGKTVVLDLLVAQAVIRGWDVIIVDPKGTDFAWTGMLPGLRLWTLDEAPLGLDEAVGEMQERQALASRHVWSGAPGADEHVDLLAQPGQPYRPCLVVADEVPALSEIGDSDRQKQTQECMGLLARLARAQGMVCAFAAQRPDRGFLSGATKSNLGTRILVMSDGDTQMTSMVLDRASGALPRLSASVRGRGRVLVTGEGSVGGNEPVEYQGAYISVASIKRAIQALPVNELTPARFAEEPAWRSHLRRDQTPPESRPPSSFPVPPLPTLPCPPSSSDASGEGSGPPDPDSPQAPEPHAPSQGDDPFDPFAIFSDAPDPEDASDPQP